MTYLGSLGNADSIVRSHTQAQWATANYDLRPGQIGVESDTGRTKFGVGKPWNSTSYTNAPGTASLFSGTQLIEDVAASHTITVVNGVITDWQTS